MKRVPLNTADYERWQAQSQAERLPFLLPLDRRQLPPHLEGELLRAWLGALKGERAALVVVREYDEGGEEVF